MSLYRRQQIAELLAGKKIGVLSDKLLKMKLTDAAGSFYQMFSIK